VAELSVYWLRIALLLYSIGLWHSLRTVIERRQQRFLAALTAISLGAVFHLLLGSTRRRRHPARRLSDGLADRLSDHRVFWAYSGIATRARRCSVSFVFPADLARSARR
jgi:hypothetical protein